MSGCAPGKDYVYLDYAATAPLVPEVLEACDGFLAAGAEGLFANANANSLHSPGREAYRIMEQARRTLAECLGADRPSEVVFTSGATEADNAALLGLSVAQVQRRRQAGRGEFTPHVIVSAIEHDAVLAAARSLESQGFRVTRLRPDRQGFVEVRSLEQALDDDTVLVSVQAANSEVGSVQPVRQLADAAHAAGALFHTDAVQAFGKMPVSVGEWGVDAASFSGHKLGAFKGVGALYLRARTPFAPTMLGGGQESGLRSGTQNVMGMVAFAAAARAAVQLQEAEGARLRALRDRLYARLACYPQVQPTVEVPPLSEDFLPNIVNVLVDGLESQTLILRFDALGFGVSGGSACSSQSLDPSHVLLSLGVDSDTAQGALRISMGRYTTEADVDGFVEAFGKVLAWNS